MLSRFFFLLCLGVLGLFSPKGEAKLDPLSHAMLSDPKYAKQIEVQCYLVEREQLAELFANEKTQIIQKPNKELYQKKLFLLVRSRNRGNHVAFGTLKCLPPNCSSPIAVDLSRMWGHQTSFDDYVIYMGELILSSFADNELPNITYKWDCIYTM